MQDKKAFGQYIRQKREGAGLSQHALADRLHIVESTVSKWERGLSYPDVTLIPDICQALSISEHEFFNACDDEKAAAQERYTRRWERFCRRWRPISTAVTLTALIVCFVCNAAIFHRLDWFWIVLTSFGVWYSLTTLPLWLERNRLFWALAGASVSLLLLLFSCWLYTGGLWLLMGVVITAVCLALPWGLYALWRYWALRPILAAAGLFSLWLPFLLVVIWLFCPGDWLFSLALPIAGLCLLLGWGVLGALALPVDHWFKSGLITLLCALSIPAGNALSDWTAGWWAVLSHFAAYFLPRRVLPGEEINMLVMWLLLAAALVFFIAALVRRCSKK